MVALTALVATTFIVVQPAAPATAAGSSCGATINPIVCENSKPGTDPDVWDIEGAGDSSIQGFATDISVNAGQKIDFKIDTNARAYSIDIYRTGWYQGLGARKITSVSPSATLPQAQPQCISDVTTELYDCGTWKVSASWNVPADAVSGVYVAKLTRADDGGASHIIFIVRNDGSTSDVLFQTSDPTWQAYNKYGGSDFYQGAANNRAYKISYNRPFATRGSDQGRDFYFSSEYATVRFMERNGYDVSYLAGIDTDRRGAELRNHKVFMSVGHDEYVSGAQRANIMAARDAGVNLQFLTGNEAYWRTRYENSVDGSNTPYRTLVSYKETWANAKIDPSSEWTGTWRDPRFATAAQGGHLPENALSGTMFQVNNDDLAVTVNSAEGKTRLWRNTALASLASGASAALAPHTVGYESNEDVDNGYRPAGLVRLSTTTGAVPQYLTDYGSTVVPGTTQHHVTLYRASSGALVFSSASIQWGWGLDQTHDGDGAAADVRMQQAQVNLFADMGAQPGTLMSGLSAAAKSTDTTAPTTVITTPTAGQSIAHGTAVTMTGTAADAAGVVAGVEVSVDGGSTWHAATGTTNWTYTYIQQGYGQSSVLARGIDDSGNYSSTGTSRAVTVTGPASVYGAEVPATPSATDTSAVEVGLRFSASVDGFVTGARFYKGSANTGTHVASLWTTSGTRLATATFANETATGWQTVQFTAPVAIVGGTDYVVSYTAPRGGYAYVDDYWPYKAKASSPLTVTPAVGAASPGLYGSAGSLPTNTWGNSNYFVDPLFTATDNSPLGVASRTPLPSSSSVALDTKVSATFTRAAAPASIAITVKNASGTAVPGSVSYDAPTKTATFQPTGTLAPATAYTVTLAATDTSGVSVAANSGWTFTTQAADLPVGTCPCSLFSESIRPVVDSDTDTALVTLGVKFTPTVDGTITAVKFFKGVRNTGAHNGALWSASGTKLASVTFTNESSYGWQTAVLSTPIAVTAGQTYVASYLAPEGGYSATLGQYSGGYTRGPLTVVANGGAFTYADGFPGSSSPTNYLVDVVLQTGAQGPTLVATTPASGTVDVAADTGIDATYNLPITSGFTGTVKANGATVAGTWTLSSDSRTAKFQPAAALPAGASIAVALSNVTGTSGAAAQNASWSFTVVAANSQPVITLIGNLTPQVAAEAGDTASVELGMSFRSSAAGTVRAVRFYKGPGNSGTHVGSLWGPNGELLSQVTFANESATGWQRAVFAVPVSITPNTTYTVSYLAPNGSYSYTPAGFASPITSGPLTTETVNNGKYRYGAGGTMPNSSWNATNYFVDVEFMAAADVPKLTSTSPARDAAGVVFDANVTATFDRDMAGSSPTLSLQAGTTSIQGTSAYDAVTKRLTFDPAADLSAATTYTATVRVSGATFDTWSFSTADAAATGQTQNLFGVETPQTESAADSDPVELGTAFQVTEAGKVTAIRFYKGAGNVGVHTGTLWSSTGQSLATVTFTGESASGWQRAVLSVPVDVVPGQTYVVSYFAPSGGYSVSPSYFTAPKVSGKIVGIADTNGRFFYGAGGGFPTTSWSGSAYFVDAEVMFGATGPTPPPAAALVSVTPAASATNVDPTTAAISATLTNATTATLAVTSAGVAVPGTSSLNTATGVVTFAPSAAYDWGKTYAVTLTANGAAISGGTWSFSTLPRATITARTPASAATNVDPATAKVTATLTGAMTAAIQVTLAGANVAGTSALNTSTGVVTFTPTAQLDWTKTYTATVTANGTSVANGAWSFTTMAKPDQVSLFTTGTPTNANANAVLGYQAGTRFRSSAAGVVTTIRFYKGNQNTGAHTGYVRNASGTVLAQVTFQNETASGWQTAVLSTPVRLTVGAEYRVTVYSASGRYAVTTSGLATTVTVGPLSTIGGIAGFGTANPTTTSTNKFWVDVVFDPDN
ncbi:DUF4082 domain-containing protein [Microbacterium pumilum]